MRLFSGATVHGFPVIRTDQPSRFGTQVIRGSADKKNKFCFHALSACLEDNSDINNSIKYRSEIQFLLFFPTEIKGFTKCQIKHDRNCISLPYLMIKKKKTRMSAVPWASVDSKHSPGNADILNLKL